MNFNYQSKDLKKFTFFFTTVTVGFIFNFALIYFANLHLSNISFGTFYLSLTLLNITIFAFQPFSFLVIRKVADERNLKMQNKLIKYFINLVISYSLTGLFFSSFLLAIAHSIFNFNSIYLYYFLLLAATTYFSSEILRNILESKKMINQLSLYFLLWCFLKFFISAAFIYYIKTAFSGVLGIWISSIIIFIIFFFYFVKKIKLKLLISLKLKYFEFRETINVLFFYFLIFLLFNLDIILCYFFYEKEILGIYSASSVLAKGVIVFFNPFMKIFIPFSINVKKIRKQKINNTIYIYLFVLLLIGIFFLIFSETYLNSDYKFKNTDNTLFKFITISIFPLSIFRIIAMQDFAKFRESKIFYLIIPIILYTTIVSTANFDIYNFSKSFVFLSFFVLIYYFIISLFYKFIY